MTVVDTTIEEDNEGKEVTKNHKVKFYYIAKGDEVPFQPMETAFWKECYDNIKIGRGGDRKWPTPAVATNNE